MSNCAANINVLAFIAINLADNVFLEANLSLAVAQSGRLHMG